MRIDNQMAGLRQNPMRKKATSIQFRTPINSSSNKVNLSGNSNDKDHPVTPKTYKQHLYISSKLVKVAHAFNNKGLL
jgi:hypothetical protein